MTTINGPNDPGSPEPRSKMTDPTVIQNGDPVMTGAERKKAVLEQQQYVTGRIGETCRYIGFALLAAFYAIENSDKPFSRSLLVQSTWFLELMALLASAGIVSDYLQYFCGEIAVRKAISENNYRYNSHWLSYRLRTFFYVFKQWATLIAAFLLIYVIVRKLVS